MTDLVFLLRCQVLCLWFIAGATATVGSEVLCSTSDCYTVHLDTTRGFQQANDACKDNGGHLATVKSQEEALYLQHLLLKIPSSALPESMLKFWIGLYLEKKQCYQKSKALKGFSWITDRGRDNEEENQFSNWMEEPMATCTTKRCVTMNFNMTSTKNFKWTDGKCLSPVNGYVCKFSFRGMCRQVALAGPGKVEYLMPFRSTSTTLNLVPFGTGAYVHCGLQKESGGPFLICKDNGDNGFDWSPPGPFCASLGHGCSFNNGGCDQECTFNTKTGSIKCGCKAGYELMADGISCAAKDHCKSNPCQQICKNLQEGFKCTCLNGYILAENNISCIDVDECLQSPCDQVCTNSPGSFSCSCMVGFETVGRSCKDKDECWHSSPCAQGCINTNGSYTCYCKEGYVKGEGEDTCLDVDECEKTPCEDLCNNTLGSYICACGPGLALAPDGISCLLLELGIIPNTPTASINSPSVEQKFTQTQISVVSQSEMRPDKILEKGSEEPIRASRVPSTSMPASTLSSNTTGAAAKIENGSTRVDRMLLYAVVASVIAVVLLLAFVLGVLKFRRKKAKKESKATPEKATDGYCWEESKERAVDNEYR
ncbi:hypothetical protein NDU88_009108 [Pleurodeles waltl]|uniref:Complement component C1q receptor n=1 Tax=Pleurodeles waltl TaxID=8319 RepID=A0AAV7RZI1_PLEWA|nr:hypothetical protein NDU88_009108 [Pleurodeles waltl]